MAYTHSHFIAGFKPVSAGPPRIGANLGGRAPGFGFKDGTAYACPPDPDIAQGPVIELFERGNPALAGSIPAPAEEEGGAPASDDPERQEERLAALPLGDVEDAAESRVGADQEVRHLKTSSSEMIWFVRNPVEFGVI